MSAIGIRARGSDALRNPWPESGIERISRCPICGCGERVLVYQGLEDRVFFCAPGQWSLYECGGCHSLYLNPRPTPSTIGAAYASYYTHQPTGNVPVDEMRRGRRYRRAVANGYRNWRYGTAERPAVRVAAPLVLLAPVRRTAVDVQLRHLPRNRPGARLLDVGCGSGEFLSWATRAGWKAFGLDPDPAAVWAARSKGLNVFCGTIEAVRADGPFDVVTLSHVLEHVHDPRSLLRGVYELLKPGGIVWVDTPNVGSYGHRFFGAAWRGLEPPRHLVLFNHRSLRRLLTEAGFVVERVVARPDAAGFMFPASWRLATGLDPAASHPASLGVRCLASLAAMLAIIRPSRSEFLTLIARR